MMNKRLYAVVVAGAMTASLLAGCGSSSASDASTEASSESSTEAAETKTYAEDAYTSGITASEYVTLPDYAEIPVEVEDPREEITDDYVDEYIQYVLASNQELVDVTDRAVQDGDVVNIDFVGKVDGVAFDGGTSEGYDLTIGSNRFIDDFEEQLIGWEIGDSDTIEVTFPETYSNNPDLAGQDATFDVTINSIQEYQTPAFTDEWVASQSIDGVTTTDEYTAYTKEQLLADAQDTYDSNIQGHTIQYLIDNGTWLQDPPADMVDRWYDSTMNYYETYASYYGVDVSELLTTIGYDADTYEDQLRSEAEDTARQAIVLQAVADAEDLNLTDAEYKTQVSTLAAQQGYSDSDSFEEAFGENYIREYLTSNRAGSFLQEKAVVTAPAADTTDEADAATTEAATADTEAAEADTEAAAE